MIRKNITLDIASRLENMDMVGKSIYGICSLAGISASDTVRIELCVGEAVTTSIKHAYGLDCRNWEVRTKVTLADENFKIEVCDQGKTMPDGILEAAKQPIQFDPDDIEALITSGRGLKLITEIMDTVDYRQEDGWNCLVMNKKLNKESKPSC